MSEPELAQKRASDGHAEAIHQRPSQQSHRDGVEQESSLTCEANNATVGVQLEKLGMVQLLRTQSRQSDEPYAKMTCFERTKSKIGGIDDVARRMPVASSNGARVITLQRARDRPTGVGGGPASPTDEPFASLKGCLRQLAAEVVPPKAAVGRVMKAGEEVVLYVYEGSVELDARLGHEVELLAGDFARLTVEARTEITVFNTSHRTTARVYQVLFGSEPSGVVKSFDRRRFTVAERAGLGCLIAGEGLRREGMMLHHDARVYSGVLQRGQHVVHDLSPGRVAWVDIIQGEVSVSGTNILAGDRVCVSGQRTASLTSGRLSEVLLIDITAPESADEARKSSFLGSGRPKG